MKLYPRKYKFNKQKEATVYRYSYRIIGEGPEALETKFEEQWYTGWLNRTTDEGPVGF